MALRDKNIDWKRALYFIPWTQFHRVAATDVTMAGTDEVPTEISTLGIGGFLNTTNNVTVATLDQHLLATADFSQEIGFRVLWAIVGGSTEATDDITWRLLYELYAPGSAMGAIDTALSTAIPQQVNMAATQYNLCRGARGIIAGGTIGVAHRSSLLGLKVDVSATTFSASEYTFLGLQVDYYPMRMSTSTEAKHAVIDLSVTG